jgi:hypothetical protein
MEIIELHFIGKGNDQSFVRIKLNEKISIKSLIAELKNQLSMDREVFEYTITKTIEE